MSTNQTPTARKRHARDASTKRVRPTSSYGKRQAAGQVREGDDSKTKPRRKHLRGASELRPPTDGATDRAPGPPSERRPDIGTSGDFGPTTEQSTRSAADNDAGKDLQLRAHPYETVADLGPILNAPADASCSAGSDAEDAARPQRRRRIGLGPGGLLPPLRLLKPGVKRPRARPLPGPAAEIYRLDEVLRRLREIHGAEYLEGLERYEADSVRKDIALGAKCDAGCSSARIRAALVSSRHRGDLALSEHEGIGLLSSEEQLRAKRLRALLLDERGGRRRQLIADASMVSRVDMLRLGAPHCDAVITTVSNASRLSLAAQRPLSLPPLLLLGEPGVGKTTFAESLAVALGTSVTMLAISGTAAWGLFQGLPSSWKGAAVGKIAQALVDGDTAAPVVIYDEIDKVNIARVGDRPLDPLHGLLEARNAAAWRDEYFDVAFDTRGVIHICTANAVDSIAPSLLDRMLVLTVPTPTPAQRALIAQQIYAQAVADLGDLLPNALTQPIVDRLAATTPRRVARLLQLAIPAAVAAGRRAVTADDLDAALKLINGAIVPTLAASPRPIGFLADLRSSSSDASEHIDRSASQSAPQSIQG